jgi:hypothetical protein
LFRIPIRVKQTHAGSDQMSRGAMGVADHGHTFGRRLRTEYRRHNIVDYLDVGL